MEDHATSSPMHLPGGCWHLLGVFDGHEGPRAADYMERQLPLAVRRRVQRALQSGAGDERKVLRAALEAALLEVDAAVLAKARAEGSWSDGSTVVVALVSGGWYLLANIGDSAAIMCGWNQGASGGSVEARLLTRLHRPDNAEERRRVAAAGGNAEWSAQERIFRTNGVLSVSRSVGDLPHRGRGLTADADVSDWQKVQESDSMLVLVSDGVLDVLSTAEVCEIAAATWDGSIVAKLSPPPPLPIMLGPPAGSRADAAGHASVAEPSIGPPATLAAAEAAVHGSGDGGCIAQLPAAAQQRRMLPTRDWPGAALLAPACRTLAQAVSEALTLEAYRQISTDNLAAAVLDFGRGSERQSGGETELSAPLGQESGQGPEPPRPPPPEPAEQPPSCQGFRGAALQHLAQVHAAEAEGPGEGAPPQPPLHHEWQALQGGYRLRRSCALLPAMPQHRHLRIADASVHQHSLMLPPPPELPGGTWLPLREAAAPLPATAAVELPAPSPQCSAGGGVDAGTTCARQPADDEEEAALAAAPMAAVQDGRSDATGSYRLLSQLGQGHFGVVFQAAADRLCGEQEHGQQQPRACLCRALPGGSEPQVVLKRILVEKGEGVKLSAIREAYYGRRFPLPPGLPCRSADAVCRQLPGDCLVELGRLHVVRFLEAFSDVASHGDPAVWLAMCDEGTSLHDLMYEVIHSSGHACGRGSSGGRCDGADAEAGASSLGQLLQPSTWWRGMRTSPAGHEVIRDILRQTLQGLAAIHAANVTHRDLKPENLLLEKCRPCSSSVADAAAAGMPGGCCEVAPQLGRWLRIIDFGSAVDARSAAEMYGEHGPSEEQQTLEYAPPEALFGRYWTGRHEHLRTWPYDMWSVGVLWLEMVLGTPHVFQVSARARVLLDSKLQLGERSDYERHLAFVLRGMMELCIYPPGPPLRRRAASAGRHAPPAQPQPPAAAQPYVCPAVRWPPWPKLRNRGPELPLRTVRTVQQLSGPRRNGSTSAPSWQALLPEAERLSASLCSLAEQPPRPQSRGSRRAAAAGPSSKAAGGAGLQTWKCSDSHLMQLVRERDPTGVGMDGQLAIRLLRALLHWAPQQRPTPLEALNHAFFTGPSSTGQGAAGPACHTSMQHPHWC